MGGLRQMLGGFLGRVEEAPPELPGLALNLLYDSQTAEVLRRVLEPDSSCIDVGCHKGDILDIMLRHAPLGRHFAFEPIPHMCMRLRGKYARMPAVEIHELALSEAPGESTFQHVVSNPGYSGILRRRYDRPDEEIVEIRVRLARMDDVIPGDAQIRLVKIDVEGAELLVLRGGMGTLRRTRPFVVFEHGQASADTYRTRPEQVFETLAECGLKISLMGDWLASPQSSAMARERFVAEYEQSTNYYFLAHP